MSRVTRSTLLSVAACGLIVTAGAGLAGCGGDDEKAATAVKQTSPVKRSTAPMPKVLTTKVAVTKEGQAAIDAASTKAVTTRKLSADAKSALKKLKAAGLDAKQASRVSSGAAVIQVANTAVMIYPSEQMAASQAASFIRVINAAKTDGRVARYDRTVIATSAPDGMDASLSREFKSVQKAIK